MKTELLGFASCLILENSIKSFSSLGYTDDTVGKSDLSVHLTSGKNDSGWQLRIVRVLVRYVWCHSKPTEDLQQMQMSTWQELQFHHGSVWGMERTGIPVRKGVISDDFRWDKTFAFLTQ